MKKSIITIITVCVCGILPTQAQQSIDEVLQYIEQSSKELQAQRRLTEAQKLEARTGNSLQNPTVELENLWRHPAKSGSDAELTVMQGFDFPSAYVARNQIAKLKGFAYESQGAEVRQQILLQAKQLCLEIIYLRQQQASLNERLSNTKRLATVYAEKLEAGTANILETNKINVELITTQTAVDLNATSLRTCMEQLSNLAGGNPVNFTATEYPVEQPLPDYATLEALYLEQNPELQRLAHEHSADQKSIALNKALGLPKFEVGYRHNYGLEGRLNGFAVGMSIPMFENKNKVKAARAQSYFSDTKLQSAKLNNITQLKQLYQQALTLRASATSLETILRNQNTLGLLNKALDAGQISVIEYFTEVNALYQNRETLLKLQKDYRTVTAQIFRYEL